MRHNEIHDLYQELKYKENKTEIEEEFMSEYYSWDKGDCSEIGLISLYLKFLLRNEQDNCYSNYEKIDLVMAESYLNNLEQ